MLPLNRIRQALFGVVTMTSAGFLAQTPQGAKGMMIRSLLQAARLKSLVLRNVVR